jgi:nitrogen fixation NifU-like protein|tara:strand:- start:1286 stop:1708 length:423 start_codon:yes stop_codon:yes gene_type:complete
MIDELYQEVILDHSKSPRNFGVLDQYTCTAEGNNPMCGDQLTVYVDIKDDIVSDVSFRARGCAISIASASIMSSMIKGRTIEELHKLFDKFHKLCMGEEMEDDDDIERLRVLSGVSKFPTRVKCATMSWHAVREAVDNTE